MKSLARKSNQAQASTGGGEGRVHPGPLIERFLRAGLDAGPLRPLGAPVSGDIDWATLCTVAYRCRIAPILYQSFRNPALAVPPDVLHWFRAQHYEAVARNMALLNELREVLAWFSGASIPAMVLKGPVLGSLGLGAARVSSDLDILVRNADLRSADAILQNRGYREWAHRHNDNHRFYCRCATFGMSVVELHFDLSDRLRSYRPDVDGIWHRSRMATVSQVPMRVPELTDHLLLTIMQLPHHHWAVRLVVDLWQVALRQGDLIQWPALLERAAGWQMSTLTRAAVHALWALFAVPMAPAVVERASPVGYLERLQWRAAKCAIAEQLEYPFRPRVVWLVPFLMVDQVRRMPAILVRRSLGLGGSPDESPVSKATRRGLAGVAALPAIGKVLVESIGRSTLRPGWPK
ncbi:MAG: nucleotidyltransferase family protein [Armatimonadota bacterium]|nr:nucleotidyltransferase family protein [Armatimonadota bacterium]MDR7468299.1 nucleotidyltransferase family protein [Armatimonadota bacterium]MDR7494691.1 nucleotidyltransferase family protein [Armatimonadota bacterium]MDR7500237.1 nucleotidyltransferase family protein [Armatimonadota bacterium]MDR7505617.1 nucleotidyltransferase family protein [Armatimonadota bacterium]